MLTRVRASRQLIGRRLVDRKRALTFFLLHSVTQETTSAFAAAATASSDVGLEVEREGGIGDDGRMNGRGSRGSNVRKSLS